MSNTYAYRFGEVVDGKFNIVSLKNSVDKIAAMAIDSVADEGDAVRVRLGDNSTTWNSASSDATVMITNAKGGSGGSLSAVENSGAIYAFDNIVGGTGYSGSATITISGGGATVNATGEIDISGSAIFAARSTIGSSYTSAPTVVFTGGGFSSTATATCTINSSGQINTLTITSAGSGYSSAPTISFSGGGGAIGNTGQCIASLGGGSTVTSMFLLSGSGYGGLGAGNPTVTVVDLSSDATNIVKFTDGTSDVMLERTTTHDLVGGATINATSFWSDGNMILGKNLDRINYIYTGQIYSSGGFTSDSDQRIKTNIAAADISNCLSNINDLSLKTYNYVNTTNMTTQTVHGFIAQDVKSVIPAAVDESSGKLPSGEIVDDFHYLTKSRIFTQLVGAVQKLSQKVDDLTQRIEVLES